MTPMLHDGCPYYPAQVYAIGHRLYYFDGGYEEGAVHNNGTIHEIDADTLDELNILREEG